MMYLELQNIIKDISFCNAQFLLRSQIDERIVTINFKMKTTDSKTFKPTTVIHGRSFNYHLMEIWNKDDVLKFLLQIAERAYAHETKEFFLYKKQMIFNPHKEVQL